MSRNQAIVVENNFSKGLITEATGLNFPENAATSSLNVVFKETGRAYKRKGIDFEPSYSTVNITRGTTDVVRTYQWRSVRGNGSVNFTVTQVGATLYFYQENGPNSLSAGRKSFKVNLNSFDSGSSSSPAQEPCDFASGNNGYLFVFNKACDPFYCVMSSNFNSITTTRIVPKIRDMKGLPEPGVAVDTRPKSLTSTHRYNLLNQGWGTITQAVVNGIEVTQQALQAWDISRTDFPSNADAWWYYKIITASDSSRVGKFRPEDGPGRFEIGNTPAPKGHFILEAFNLNRTDVSGVTGVTSEYTLERPSAGAFFAGRIFMGGVSDSGFAGRIYFSQIIENDEQIEKCYQENDPTSEKISDLLPTDGGVIVITDLGSVIKMIPIGPALVVFASNGIWAISGSEGVGFTANDYSIQKLSSSRALSIYSFIDIEGFPLWWNEDGIYTVKGGEGQGLMVESLTDRTIKSHYSTIPSMSKQYASGAYDPINKVVQWGYVSTAPSNIREAQDYSHILCLNLLSGAFYLYTAGTTSAAVSGIVCPVGGTIKYFAASISGSTYRYSFAQEYRDTYRDWEAAISVSGAIYYDAYIVTGYRIRGEGLRDAQSNYVSVFFDTLANSSCWLQGVWDYANSGNSGRWSTPQQAYKVRPNADVQWSRLKVRGRGKSLQFRLQGETGKPFSIIGWSVLESVNGGV